MSIAGDKWKRLFLAPAGRHVYRQAAILKPQRGDMFIAGDKWKRLPLAPAGRHVYSRRQVYRQAAGGSVCL